MFQARDDPDHFFMSCTADTVNPYGSTTVTLNNGGSGAKKAAVLYQTNDKQYNNIPGLTYHKYTDWTDVWGDWTTPTTPSLTVLPSGAPITVPTTTIAASATLPALVVDLEYTLSTTSNI